MQKIELDSIISKMKELCASYLLLTKCLQKHYSQQSLFDLAGMKEIQIVERNQHYYSQDEDMYTTVNISCLTSSIRQLEAKSNKQLKLLRYAFINEYGNTKQEFNRICLKYKHLIPHLIAEVDNTKIQTMIKLFNAMKKLCGNESFSFCDEIFIRKWLSQLE